MSTVGSSLVCILCVVSEFEAACSSCTILLSLVLLGRWLHTYHTVFKGLPIVHSAMYKCIPCAISLVL